MDLTHGHFFCERCGVAICYAAVICDECVVQTAFFAAVEDEQLGPRWWHSVSVGNPALRS